jgi:hypothetical protein
MTRQIVPGTGIGYAEDSTAVLTYALGTDPVPLTVSDSAVELTLGSLQIVITNNSGGDVQLCEVDFTVQVGVPDPVYGAPLMQTTAGVTTQVSDEVNWSCPVPTVSQGQAVFSLLPKTGLSVTLVNGASLVVDIVDFPTVLTPSTATLLVKETTMSGSGGTDFSITTFPADFNFTNLVAAVLQEGAYVPVAQVANGTAVTLLWSSSVVDPSAIDIYYANGTPAQNPTETGKWVSPQLSADTVFTVVIKASVLDGQPITMSLSVPVSVQMPALVASSLSVSGNVAMVGASQVIASPVPVTGSYSASQSYVAPSDGFVFGWVAANDGPSSQAAIAWIELQNSLGAKVIATGGNYIPYAQMNPAPAPPLQFSFSSLNQSIFLPVRSGETFTVAVTFDQNNQSNPVTSFWYVPLGGGTLGP